MLHGMAKKKAQPTKQNTMVTLETQLRNTSEHEAALTFRSELQNAECSWGGGGKEEVLTQAPTKAVHPVTKDHDCKNFSISQ